MSKKEQAGYGNVRTKKILNTTTAKKIVGGIEFEYMKAAFGADGPAATKLVKTDPVLLK